MALKDYNTEDLLAELARRERTPYSEAEYGYYIELYNLTDKRS